MSPLPWRHQFQICRRAILLAPWTLRWARALEVAGLQASWDGDNLHVAAPQLHFLAGRTLEKLKDGAAVPLFFQFSLSFDGNRTTALRSMERFVLSYDLWEEKFSVVRMGSASRTASRLSAAGAEVWCLDNLALSTQRIAPDRQFWLRLEVRGEDAKNPAGVIDDSGINLTRLIEIFSRPPGSQQAHASLEAGPLRLADLRRNPQPGTRGA